MDLYPWTKISQEAQIQIQHRKTLCLCGLVLRLRWDSCARWQKSQLVEKVMRVYEPESSRRKAEMLSHLLMLSRSQHRERLERQPPVHGAFSRDLITNIRRFGYTPSLRQLHALSQYLDLTIGGAFKLFGYSLESMRHLDFLLNGERTRFIETYPFYRDRPVDVPQLLGNSGALHQNSFLYDFVRSWRIGIPIRAIRGPHWRRRKLLYAQIGTRDGMALPRIPPGSIIAVQEIDENERRNPDSSRYYLLQHHAGYICSRCVAEKGRLLLITRGQKIGIRQEFEYPGEARIVGQVVSFAAKLPAPALGPLVSNLIWSKDTPLILPWEHTSFTSLLKAETVRFGITEAHLTGLAPLLKEQLGVALSSRTLRRYQRIGNTSPRTAVLLGIAAVLSLRLSDVFRVLKMWGPTVQQLSLTTLLDVDRAVDLPSSFDAAPRPEPFNQWNKILEEWGEWPSLISMAFPRIGTRQEHFLRLSQARQFGGLRPIVGDGAIVHIDDQDVHPTKNGGNEQEGWDRPIYVLRHRGETLIGYLESDETHLALQPHPLAGIPRILFPRARVEILGRVTGIASPV